MNQFLKTVKKDLKKEQNEKAQAAIEALFDLSEENLFKAHDDVTPSFCKDVVMITMIVREMMYHLSDYDSLQALHEAVELVGGGIVIPKEDLLQ